MQRQGFTAVEDQVRSSRRRRCHVGRAAAARRVRASSRAAPGWPPRRRVSGSYPASPSSTALSLPCPLPVAPSEPKSSARTRAVASSRPSCRQAQREQPRRAHRAHGVRAGWADADLEQVEDGDGHREPALGRVRRHRHAAAEQVAVAVDVVDAPDRRPVLVAAQARHRVGGVFARVGVRSSRPSAAPRRCAARSSAGCRPSARRRARPARISSRMAIIASQKRSSSASGSLSVGSTISVPATGKLSVGAWKP